MSYKVYQTEGFVIGARAFREEDGVFSILTPDLGLIYGNARSVRSMRSKLKGHLTTYSHIELSLVRGRETWRLISTQKTGLSESFLNNHNKRLTVARIFQLAERLIAGESENEPLYIHLKNFTEALAKLPPEDAFLLKNYESVMVLRLLNSMGYLEAIPSLKTFTINGSWEPSLIRAIAPLQKTAIKAINESFSASQM